MISRINDLIDMDDGEINSSGVVKVMEWLDYMIAKYRKTNDNTMSADETANTRGKIGALKHLKECIVPEQYDLGSLSPEESDLKHPDDYSM